MGALVVLALVLFVAPYNNFVKMRNQIQESWRQVDVELNRRYELIPNLVETVKGYAQQEKDVLLGVTNARAKVGSIQATPEVLNDPAAFQKFTQAQGELTSALSRLPHRISVGTAIRSGRPGCRSRSAR